MAGSQKYSFKDNAPPVKNSRKHRRKSDGKKKSLNGSLGQKLESHFQREAGHHHHHEVGQQRHYAMGGGGEKEENSVAEGSLTYSASSSMGGSSNAGESTDSSFADIMKVLDLGDNTSEIAALMAKEGITDMSTQEYVQDAHARAQARRSNRAKGSEASVANSLAYSEDGESTIADAAYNSRYGAMPNTMHSGQPSDSHGPDGGGFGGLGGEGLAFTPAEETGSDLVSPSKVHEGKSHSRPKSESMREKAKKGKKPQPSPSATDNGNKVPAKRERSPTPDTSTASSNSAPPSSPPPRGKRGQRKVSKDSSGNGEKAEAWYSQWWMCGFSDALKDVVGAFGGK